MQGGDFIVNKIAVIYLLTEKYGKNDMDDPVTTLKGRKIIARMKRIRQSEHWQSRAAGFKPEIQFVIRDFEYDNEKQLEYNGVIYDIERVDGARGIDVELVCSKEINKSTKTQDGG